MENDIYYLEVCVLNEMCKNRDEIFTKEHGESFYVAVRAANHAQLTTTVHSTTVNVDATPPIIDYLRDAIRGVPVLGQRGDVSP